MSAQIDIFAAKMICFTHGVEQPKSQHRVLDMKTFPFAKYRSRPLHWWMNTPLYAKRHILNFLGKFISVPVVNGGENDIDRVVYNSFFRSQRKGVFIEVGAAHPHVINIGAWFRRRGFRVISIEPNPIFCDMHRAKGNEIHQYACGAHDEDNVEFCVVRVRDRGEHSYDALSSLSIKPDYLALEAAENVDIKKIRVNLRRLDTILRDHAPEVANVDCLSIDVEGWELEVLEGFDLEKFQPRILIIENMSDDVKYREYMAAHNYRLWRTIAPNEIYERVD